MVKRLGAGALVRGAAARLAGRASLLLPVLAALLLLALHAWAGGPG